jgi:uncharacterized protein (TIGR00255 family)
MIKSMTGFGRGEYSDEKRSITIEIKSVNHRYSEVYVRIPRRYSFAEEHVRNKVKDVVKRGKIDVSVSAENLTEEDLAVKLNIPAAKQYFSNLREIQRDFDVEGEITLEMLASMPDVLKAVPDVDDEEAVLKAIDQAVKQALDSFDKMRMAEGTRLEEDILERGDIIKDYVREIEEVAPQMTKLYSEKLKDRVTELIDKNIALPEDRIALETAIFADKSNITEEIVRLKSHIKQLKSILAQSGAPVGKKLDFLIQEFNRETNTIGSKANDLNITNTMLEMKSEIEKIREQVQNIE